MIRKLAVPGPIEDVEELRVLMWHGGEGTAFSKGDLIVELETHKAIVEVRAGGPGVLRKILCAEGGWEKAGRALALVGDDPADPLPGSTDALEACPAEFDVV
jgi:pyruvate/2-oxoglutarate dehydrogenase complex dihydrolipoamide acyltransferase (E2) component